LNLENRTTSRSNSAGSDAARCPSRRRSLAIVLCVLAFIRACETLWRIRHNHSEWDFSHYYASALAARLGLNPYTTPLTDLASALGLHLGAIDRGAYPPTFILCFEPLTLLTPAVSFWIWTLTNAALLAILLVWLCRRIAATDTWAAYSFAALAILYPPLQEHFRYAQSQILISVLLLMMYSAGDELAGISLALATLLRVFPAVMMGYFLARRRWRALFYFAVGMVAGGLVTLGAFGFDRSISFLRAIPFLMSNRWLAHNISIGALVTNLYLLFRPQGLTVGSNLGLWVLVLSVRLFVLSLAWRLTTRLREGEQWNSRTFPIWVATMIVIAPIAWAHYMVMLYIPFGMIVWNYLEDNATPQAARLAGLAYAIILAGSIAGDLFLYFGPRPLHSALVPNAKLLENELYSSSAAASLLLSFAGTCALAHVRQAEVRGSQAAS
jgi:hypothetical protein